MGSTKKINSESSPCKREQESRKSLTDSAELPHILRLFANLLMTITLAILHHAQPILELLLEHQSISIFQNRRLIKPKWTQLLINTLFKSEVFMVSTLRLMTVSTIFQTKEDLADPRNNLSKT